MTLSAPTTTTRSFSKWQDRWGDCTGHEMLECIFSPPSTLLDCEQQTPPLMFGPTWEVSSGCWRCPSCLNAQLFHESQFVSINACCSKGFPDAPAPSGPPLSYLASSLATCPSFTIWTCLLQGLGISRDWSQGPAPEVQCGEHPSC